jgi:hypothetical protein
MKKLAQPTEPLRKIYRPCGSIRFPSRHSSDQFKKCPPVVEDWCGEVITYTVPSAAESLARFGPPGFRPDHPLPPLARARACAKPGLLLTSCAGVLLLVCSYRLEALIHKGLSRFATIR